MQALQISVELNICIRVNVTNLVFAPLGIPALFFGLVRFFGQSRVTQTVLTVTIYLQSTLEYIHFLIAAPPPWLLCGVLILIAILLTIRQPQRRGSGNGANL